MVSLEFVFSDLFSANISGQIGILYISIVVEVTLKKETLYIKEMQLLTVVLRDSFQVTMITGD
jgi:hypothetical protein